jgi:hypothetical protein
MNGSLCKIRFFNLYVKKVSVLLISNGSSLFLLTDVYFVTIVFSEQGWLRIALSSVFGKVFHGVGLGVF